MIRPEAGFSGDTRRDTVKSAEWHSAGF